MKHFTFYFLTFWLGMLVIQAQAQYVIDFNVDQLPELNADAGASDTIIGLTTTLSANSQTNNGYWTFLSGPGNLVFEPDNTQPNPSINVDEYGNYQLMWTEDNSVCLAFDTIQITFLEDMLGISNELEDRINIYPNPTTQKLFIEIPENAAGEFTVMFHNISGKMMLRTKLQPGRNSVDVSKLNEGVFLLKLSNQQEIITRKVFIRK